MPLQLCDTGANPFIAQDEGSRLLFDDPHSSQYGTFGDQPAGVVPEDPENVQRETEALQKIVALTSR